MPGRRTRVGLVAGGLGAYWPQFPDLLPQLQRSAARVAERMRALDCDVVDVGFISDAADGVAAAERLRVSVEFDVDHGPVTTFGIVQQRDGRYRFVASTGRVVPGPLLRIGNTTSRVDFGCDPGEWVDTWSATGISHHWALATGDLVPELRATADLLGIELTEVDLRRTREQAC